MDAEIATVNREHVSLAVEKDSMDQQPLTKGHSLNLLRAMDAMVLVMNVLAVALPTANPATRTTISPISIHQIRLRTSFKKLLVLAKQRRSMAPFLLPSM